MKHRKASDSKASLSQHLLMFLLLPAPPHMCAPCVRAGGRSRTSRGSGSRHTPALLRQTPRRWWCGSPAGTLSSTGSVGRSLTSTRSMASGPGCDLSARGRSLQYLRSLQKQQSTLMHPASFPQKPGRLLNSYAQQSIALCSLALVSQLVKKKKKNGGRCVGREKEREGEGG